MKIINTTNFTQYLLKMSYKQFVKKPNEDEVKEILMNCVAIPPSGTYPELNIDRKFIDEIQGIKLNESTINNCVNLPEKRDDTIIIVSQFVYMSVYRKRNDVYVVDEPIKDAKGRIICGKSLARPSYIDDESFIDNALPYIHNAIKLTDNEEISKKLFNAIAILNKFKTK